MHSVRLTRSQPIPYEPHELSAFVLDPVVPDPAPSSFCADQSSLAKHCEVVGYGRLGKAEPPLYGTFAQARSAHSAAVALRPK